MPDRPTASRDPSTADVNGTGEPRLWDNREDEQFYGQRKGTRGSGSVSTTTGSGGGGRWHYPANFDEAEVDSQAGMEIEPSSKKKKGFLGGKKKKDRWALSEDARKGNRVPDGEYVGDSSTKKKKKESKVKRKKKGGDDDSSVGGREV